MAIAGTYGRGQMLGAGVDPSLFRQDYSGFARAGETMGQAYADLGKSIGSAITGFADIKKQNAALKAQTQSDADFAKSAQGLYKDYNPERAASLAQSIESLNDPRLNAYEKAALASGLRQNIIDGFKLEQMQSSMQMQRQRMSQMGGNRQNAPAVSIFDQ